MLNNGWHDIETAVKKVTGMGNCKDCGSDKLTKNGRNKLGT